MLNGETTHMEFKHHLHLKYSIHWSQVVYSSIWLKECIFGCGNTGDWREVGKTMKGINVSFKGIDTNFGNESPCQNSFSQAVMSDESSHKNPDTNS